MYNTRHVSSDKKLKDICANHYYIFQQRIYVPTTQNEQSKCLNLNHKIFRFQIIFIFLYTFKNREFMTDIKLLKVKTYWPYSQNNRKKN